MIKWTFDDVKRTLKSKKTFLLLTVIILSIINFVVSSVSKQNPLKQHEFTLEANPTEINSENHSVGFDSLAAILLMESYFLTDCRQEVQPEAVDCTDYNIYRKYVDEIETANRLDLSSYELQLFMLDIATDRFINNYQASDKHMQAKISANGIDIEAIIKIKAEIRQNISNKYEDFKLLDELSGLDKYIEYSTNLLHVYISYENDYPNNVGVRLTGSFFVANYLNEYFLLLVCVLLLLIFDTYYRDFKSGVFKTILTSPSRRHNYFIMKTMSSIISMTIVLFIPILVVWLILLIINGYDTFDYPIFISKTTLKSFKPDQGYTRIITRYITSPNYSTYQNICEVMPVSKFKYDELVGINALLNKCGAQIPYAYYTVIPLYEYIPIVIAYFLLVIIFISALNLAFSLIVNNQVINLILIGLVLILSIVMNDIFIGKTFLKFLPFTFISPTSLLMQTIPYTLLNGITTLLIWTLVLLILDYYLIKRKDFTY